MKVTLDMEMLEGSLKGKPNNNKNTILKEKQKRPKDVKGKLK